MELEHNFGTQFVDDEGTFELADPVNKSAEIEVDAATDNPFAEKTEINSTALIVEGRKLYVSKHVLSLVSPVFRSMFSLEMLETHMDEIPLPGKRLADMVGILRCVYPDKRKTITATDAETLVPLFEEYQIADLKEICERAISESCTVDNDIDAIFKRLLMACTYNMNIVKAKCLELASNQSRSTLKGTLRKYELPLEVTLELWELVTDKRETEIRSLIVMCEVLRTNQGINVNELSSFRISATTSDVAGGAYITSIQRAIKYKLPKTVEVLVKLYAAQLHSLGLKGFLELQNNDLSDQIKHSIFQNILRLQ